MNKKYQNGFFLFGLLVLIIMASQLDFRQAWEGIQHAGYWFVGVLVLWAFLYMMNTASWYLIINTIGNEMGVCRKCKVGFWWLYKITISAFALNYATPGGLMGGEPYRIMSLSPKVGTQRVPLYIITQKMTPLTYILLPIIAAVALLAIWFFLRGYKRGIAMTGMTILSHFPMVKKWAAPFIERNREKLAEVDEQIAALHNQNPRTFKLAVVLELLCRVASTFEIYFILLVIMPQVTIPQCILIYAFTTLFANMLFFMPLQLGGREGGFLMSTEGLSMTANAGIFVALLVRLRELIWTAIGLLLIKLDKKEK